MLRLQKHLSLHLQDLLPVHRSASLIQLSLERALLSTAAATYSSPGHFAADDYLVSTCGLTREQAAKAAKWISHWKSSSHADAVLSFLTGPALGLSKADIRLLVAKDPRILSCSVDNTLRIRVDRFHSYGFSAAQIISFVRVAPCSFRTFNIDQKLGFWMPLLGSPDKFLRIVRRNLYLVTSDLDKVVKTNIRLLQECGLSVQECSTMCVANPRLLTGNPGTTRAILVRADEMGVPRNTFLFRQAVTAVASLRPETMASKLKMMAKILRCSDAEVARMVQRNPLVLTRSRERIQRACEFLTNVVGVDTKYIQDRPTILMYSLERRLVPRHYVMKVLLEKGLIRKDQSFYSMVTLSDSVFCSKFVHPHKDVLPSLADAYASACNGKIAT
ncbi:transcription termination factor MTERF2, chloroplastic-like [Miscanthus floridulus]|uniref:transcription termination factor MTERF2, chloroplastic-like n=1 Tax=Miscanthus floridulus TaxID=154761 RepID=UPI003459FA3E